MRITRYDYYISNIERLTEMIYSVCDDAVNYGLCCKGSFYLERRRNYENLFIRH